jgi:hypothetical protein
MGHHPLFFRCGTQNVQRVPRDVAMPIGIPSDLAAPITIDRRTTLPASGTSITCG